MWTFKMDGDLKKSVQILIYKIATRLFKCLINLPFIHIFKSSEGVSISFETLVVIYQLYQKTKTIFEVVSLSPMIIGTLQNILILKNLILFSVDSCEMEHIFPRFLKSAKKRFPILTWLKTYILGDVSKLNHFHLIFVFSQILTDFNKKRNI